MLILTPKDCAAFGVLGPRLRKRNRKLTREQSLAMIQRREEKKTMKRLKLFRNGSLVSGWQFGHTKAVNLTLGKRPRKVSGWTLISEDGCERFCEGNYQQFIPFANVILENYGIQTRLS